MVVVHQFSSLRKDERMIANLSQVHQSVHERFCRILTLDHHAFLDRAVHLLLESRLVQPNDVLTFVGQIEFHFFFQSPQQEGTKHFVKSANDEKVLFIAQLHGLLSVRHVFERRGEPLFECRAAVKNLGQNEIEECPEFRQIVLQRSAF